MGQFYFGCILGSFGYFSLDSNNMILRKKSKIEFQNKSLLLTKKIILHNK